MGGFPLTLPFMGKRWDRFKGWFSGDSRLSEAAHGVLAETQGWSRPPRRGTVELLQAYKRLPYLHSLSRRVAEEVASVPFQVLGAARAARKKSFTQARGLVGIEMRRKAMKTGELTPLDGHPFLDVLTTFSPYLGPFDSRVAGQLYADLIGQVPMVRENDAQGRVVQLWPIPPHWVAEVPTKAMPFYRVAKASWSRWIPEEDMVWGRVVDPEDPYGRGTSYGEAMSGEIDVVEMTSEFVRNFFANDARPSGLVTVENDPSGAATKRMEEDWNARHRGPHKAGVVRVTNAKATWQGITPTMQQLEMTAMRQEARAIFQEVYGVPPELVGVLENSNRSTIDAAYYLMARGVVVPRLERWVSWLQPILDEYGDGLILSYENPIPEDETAERAYRIAVPSVFTVNEHRKSGGAKPMEGEEGNALYAPPAATAPTLPIGLSAGDPPWTKSLPRAVNKAAVVNAALEALRPERLTEEVGPIEEAEFARWAEEAMRELGVGVSFDMRNPLVRGALEEAGKRIRYINQTTMDALRRELNDGVFAGEGIRELTNRVEDVFTHAERYRSERIARTETVGLSNAANLSAWVQSGVVEGKEWLAINDGRSGERHHERMDGQRVGLMENFTAPSGAKAQHPGGFSDPGESVNCRCTAVAHVPDPTKAMTPEQRMAMGEAVLQKRVTMEDSLLSAFRRGFQRQRDEVLAALHSVF